MFKILDDSSVTPTKRTLSAGPSGRAV